MVYHNQFQKYIFLANSIAPLLNTARPSIPHGVGDDVGAVGAEAGVTEPDGLARGLVVLGTHLEEPGLERSIALLSEDIVRYPEVDL